MNVRQFYKLIEDSCKVRAQIVKKLQVGLSIDSLYVENLRTTMEMLKKQVVSGYKCEFMLDSNDSVTFDLTYEIEELRRDILFLDSREDFYSYMNDIHEGFSEEVDSLLRWLKSWVIRNFITDRDGTINNYCGRYSTSIQSIYNSVFITDFSRKVENSVVLTSAPLKDIGLIDISVNPENVFHYAGSKGREYQSRNGICGELALSCNQIEMLDLLSSRLEQLVARDGYEIFTVIGSGFQKKFGEITLARQDVYKTISDEKSQALLETIAGIVADVDPDGKYFRIEDTGNDIEVTLTVSDSSGNLKDFDKGDGLAFLDDKLTLRLSDGNNLICGDTRADIAMVRYAMERSSENYAVFVTEDEQIKNDVRGICPFSYFVSSPDVLIMALGRLAIS